MKKQQIATKYTYSTFQAAMNPIVTQYASNYSNKRLIPALSTVEGKEVCHIVFKVLRKLAVCSWYMVYVRREECCESTVTQMRTSLKTLEKMLFFLHQNVSKMS